MTLVYWWWGIDENFKSLQKIKQKEQKPILDEKFQNLTTWVKPEFGLIEPKFWEAAKTYANM